MLSSVSSTAFSQAFKVVKNDTIRYCVIEDVIIELYDGYLKNGINSDKVVDLEGDIKKYQGKVSKLEAKVEQYEKAMEQKDVIIESSDEQKELTKKEIRRMRNKAVGDWFKDKWQELTIGTGAFGLGVGVGYLAK